MKVYARQIGMSLAALLVVVAPTAFAQYDYPVQEEPVQPGTQSSAAAQPAQTPAAPTSAAADQKTAFTAAELDQMLAPIALYPDALLSQILMAATYPLEVVEAARWSRANSNLSGDQAVRAVDDRNWDPSVKSLVAFPNVIQMMDEKLDWTERLGDAFLGQQAQVMDSVQSLRRHASDAGNLKSGDQYRVEHQASTIIIESPNPQVVYVPYYDPVVVYGAWWWAGYPPVYWRPWPGYYAHVTYVNGFRWSVGITVGTGFFFGAWDWGHHYVRVVDARPFYYHRVDYHPVVVNRVVVWQHAPEHRRGVPYRQTWVRQQYAAPHAAPAARREVRRADVDHDRHTERRDVDRHEERGNDRGRGEDHRGNVQRFNGTETHSNSKAVTQSNEPEAEQHDRGEHRGNSRRVVPQEQREQRQVEQREVEQREAGEPRQRTPQDPRLMNNGRYTGVRDNPFENGNGNGRGQWEQGGRGEGWSRHGRE